jgi:hypothetical protein
MFVTNSLTIEARGIAMSGGTLTGWTSVVKLSSAQKDCSA